MATNQIQFGQGVYSRDGEKIGSIDHLVLNTENSHLVHLVVK
ncbi:MAG: PRC-barrel domain-containing protein [Thermomicrobiales bacterium]